MGLAYFTRPDSAIFAVIMLGLVAVHLAVKLSPLQSGSMLAVPALVYAAFPISQVAFRLSYYGELLPNTYTLKMQGIPLDVRLQSGLAFISPFLEQTALLGTILLIGLLLTRSSRQLLLVLPLPVAVVYQIYVGGEPWQLWRIMAPAMPLALCAFVLYAERALCRASDWLRPRSGIMSRWFVPIAVIGAAVAMAIDVNLAFAGQMTFKTRPFQFINNESNVNIAVALNNTLKEEATIGVIWAGTIPYYVDFYAVDYLGKCDKYVANLPPDIPDRPGNWASMRSVPGHNKQDFNYSIVEKRPTYTQTLVWGNNDVREWGARRYGSVRYLGVSLMLDKDADPVRRKLLDRT